MTERFALKTKYFYNEENLEAFREEYEAMPIQQKAMENTALAIGAIVVTVVFLLMMLTSVGLL